MLKNIVEENSTMQKEWKTSLCITGQRKSDIVATTGKTKRNWSGDGCTSDNLDMKRQILTHASRIEAFP